MPRKPFLLRIDEKVLADIQRWADDDLRSLNAQIEWLLRRALADSGRRKNEPLADAEKMAPSTPISTPAHVS